MSTNETSIDKAFYASEHSSTSNRPYVVVNYDANTSGLNYTSKSVDEGSTFQLTWSGVSSGITWTSSNTSVATVNSSGKVTGVKAGTATITASASGYTSVSCTVTVTLPYGIYYVNSSSGISIGTGGTQTNFTQVTTYLQATSGTSRYYQLWEIKHISGGKYSIRSIGNGSLLLYRYGSNAVVYNSSPSASVPTAALWKIEYTSRGYKLLNNGSSSYALTVNGSDTSPAQFVTTATYSSTSAQAHWQLQILNGVVLLDADTRTVLPENFEKAIELGDDKNQGQLGIAAVRTGNGASSTSITWTSSNTSVATISSATGYISTEGRGEAIITARMTLNGQQYSQTFSIRVIETISIINVYDITIENETTIKNKISTAVEFLNYAFVDNYLQFTMDGTPFRNPNDPISPCAYTSAGPCFCTDNCEDHHKNMQRIGDQLTSEYYESNHIIVNWSNCSKNVYCSYEEDQDPPCITTDAPAFTPLYDDRSPYPVVFIASFVHLNEAQLANCSLEDYMSVLLAHEVAHVLGLEEVYRGDYPDCPSNIDHSSSIDGMVCIMGKLADGAQNIYSNTLNYTGGFCTFCKNKLNEVMANDVLPDN